MVPLDGSEFSEQALACAYALAARTGARLHLVKVQAPEPLTAEGFFFNLQAEPASRSADQSYLDTTTIDAQRRNISVVTALLRGRVVDALATYCVERDIDFVVMTTHGRGGLSRAWLGSVADELIRRISIPLMLLRPSPKGTTCGASFDLDHILIPLDRSEESERAIEPAIALGQLTGAHYTLVEVVPPLALVPMPEAMPITMQRTEHEELRRRAAAYLNSVADRLRAKGHQVDTAVVIQPQCAAGILEQAVSTDASLIAMATHGRSGFQRLALGSVADKVLRGTTVPLLLLRPSNRDAALPALAS
jgi:nucleotide-binding universal stress UspA family protein